VAIEQLANLAITTLNGAINNSVTTLTLTSATNFSTTGNFRIVCESEIMLVTGVSGTTLTVTRGAEGTSAASHISGAPVAQVLTAGAISGNVPFLIGSQVLGSNQGTITFSSIPATWNHLRLQILGRSAGAVGNENVLIRFNSDSGANYNTQQTQSNGTSLTGTGLVNQTGAIVASLTGANVTSGYASGSTVDILGYAQTNFFKVVLSSIWIINGTSGTTNQFAVQLDGIWKSTSAIAQIDLTLVSANNFVAGSIFSLYGMP
jgi:hypothetical protein